MMKVYCVCKVSNKNGKPYWALCAETEKGDIVLTFEKNVINRLFDGVTYREDVGYKEYYERG